MKDAIPKRCDMQCVTACPLYRIQFPTKIGYEIRDKPVHITITYTDCRSAKDPRSPVRVRPLLGRQEAEETGMR